MIKNKAKDKKNFISIILARKGSKGIKNKNLSIVNGKPLIYWSIKQSLKAKKIYQTWVSSDSEKILALSKKYGAMTIKRPDKYSMDETSSEESWLHAVNFLIKKKITFENVIGIQPTSPIRSSLDFNEAIKFFKMNKLDSLFTSTKIEDHFIWERKNNKLIANYTFKKRPRRQDIKPKFLENGSFYIFNKNIFIKKKCRLFGKIGTYIQNKKIKKFQIDDEEDLKIVNVLFKKFYN